MRSLIVQKYGGSSLATPKHIRQVAQRIKDIKLAGKDLVVVVSAMGRMTDHLISLAKKTVAQPPQRELDMLMTAGERVPMALLAMVLQEEGVPAISFTGSQSGIVTSSDHTEAKIIDIKAHRIEAELGKGKVVIIAGFQGVSREKEVTTLGRGGSDTTAVALAAALKAESCEILTDVNGLFTADPRIVKEAKLLSACSYDEALELASLGAKMHSRSIELAKRFQVRIRIASSRQNDGSGTVIHPEKEKTMEKTLIRGITTKEGYHYFRVLASLENVMAQLQKNRILLRFLSCSASEMHFACEADKAASLRCDLKSAGFEFEEVPSVALVSAVGDGLSSSPEVLPGFMTVLKEINSRCYLICSNALSVTAAIDCASKDDVTRLLHRKFIEAS